MSDLDHPCLKIGTVSSLVGVSPSTLRRWEEEEKLVPASKSGLTRLYTPAQVGQALYHKAEWMADRGARPTGKLLEKQLTAYFKRLQETLPVFFYRFPDTYAAGDFLPAQPGDFFVLFRGQSVLIEAKESAKHQSLSSGFDELVKDHQATSMYLWNRAEGFPLVVFGQVVGGEIRHYEVWEGYEVALARRANRDLNENHLLAVTTDLQTAMLEVGLA